MPWKGVSSAGEPGTSVSRARRPPRFSWIVWGGLFIHLLTYCSGKSEREGGSGGSSGASVGGSSGASVGGSSGGGSAGVDGFSGHTGACVNRCGTPGCQPCPTGGTSGGGGRGGTGGTGGDGAMSGAAGGSG